MVCILVAGLPFRGTNDGKIEAVRLMPTKTSFYPCAVPCIEATKAEKDSLRVLEAVPSLR